MHRYILLFAVLLGVAAQAQAQSWTDGMFDELQFDFGSVPYGQVVTHHFRMVNNTRETVHISDVRVSCGKCSSARALKTYLQPGEETAIVAEMYAGKFIGTKKIDITVKFDKPRRDEVRIWMHAHSRQDVSFRPENLAFGKVKRGATPEGKITVAFLGGTATEILEVKSESNYVIASIKEVSRTSSETAYEITAKLRGDTPPGKWYTDIWLKTSNAGMQKIRVPVTVEIESSLSINPSTISLGQVKAGTESEKQVIIRGVKAFRITGIFGADKQVQVRAANDESKTVHILSVTLNPNAPGALSKRIVVHTDIPTGGEIEFFAKAEVIP